MRPPLAEVLDQVPVQRADVRSADLGIAGADREVDRAGHLLVVEDVPHRPRDAGVAADPELADEARALVDVERGQRARPRPAPPTPPRPVPCGRSAGSPRRARSPAGRERRSRIVPSAESSRGEKKNSPPGMFTWPSSTSPLRPRSDRCRSVSSPTMRTWSAVVEPGEQPVHRLRLRVPVAQARAVEEVLERGQRHPRLLGERVGRELAADPRDLVRHRAPEERRLRAFFISARRSELTSATPRVLSGASTVIRASMWSEA